MGNFFRSKFFIVLMIITVLIAALMILSTAGGGVSGFASNILGAVTTPVERFFYNIGSSAGNIASDITEYRHYKEKYEQAEKTITGLEAEARELTALQNENERLRELLEFKQRQTGFKTVAAEVAAKNAGNWTSELMLDKGTSSGIKENDVVITDKGLVGFVSEAGSAWARVTTIIDSSASVSCMVERTDDRAVIEGDLELMASGLCRMSYIAKDASMIVGDNVETTGLGSIYPNGIMIGKITEITPDLQGLYNQAIVKSAVDFTKIREVLVITESE